MGAKRIAVERELIVLGKELPFSVYRSDNEMLLLAKGQVVGSETMRETLIREGFMGSEHGQSANTAAIEAKQEPPKDPLDEHERELIAAAEQARVAARISRSQSTE